MGRSDRVVAAALVVLLLALQGQSSAQMPEKFENLQFFPKDIAREALVQRMREFSFALGVRCQYCHEGGDGISFEGVIFKSDAKPTKRKAREMLRMTQTLNDTLLPKIPERQTPPVRMECVICHRGLPVPKTLATELTGVIDEKGIPAAVERYRELRAKTQLLGRFNFDEWTMNELARSLVEANKTDAAIAMLELNGEYYPESSSIDFALGELHRKRNERDKAIARYTAALKKDPSMKVAQARLDELLGKK
jgi:tetratricopeptide (TPR) repeat protein